MNGCWSGDNISMVHALIFFQVNTVKNICRSLWHCLAQTPSCRFRSTCEWIKKLSRTSGRDESVSNSENECWEGRAVVSSSATVTAWYATHILRAECVPIYTIPGWPHIQFSCLGQRCCIYAVSNLDQICIRSVKSSLQVRHLPFASFTNLPLPGFPNFQNGARWRTKECKLCLSLLQNRARLGFHLSQDPNTWFRRTLFIGTRHTRMA